MFDSTHLKLGFGLAQLAKVGGDRAHDGGGEVVRPPQAAHAAVAEVALELVGEQVHVERGLANVAVELGERIAKLGDVARDQPGEDQGVQGPFRLDTQQKRKKNILINAWPGYNPSPPRAK